jgi:type IV pilus assembly protein PilC
MDYQYVGYTKDKKLVKGSISASNEGIATQILARSGYQVLSLKPVTSFLPSAERIFPSLYGVKPQTIIMFSRQLALLLESGTDIVTSLELLQTQSTNRTLKKVLSEVIADLRGGNRLSVALAKHPKVFPSIYCRSLSVGEQTGGLEIVLRQIADHMEKEVTARKGIKNALTYPIIVAIVAVVVIAVMVTFVLPAFTSLYSSLGAELPLPTRMLIAAMNWLQSYGLYLIIAVVIAAGSAFAYFKTPTGKYQWDKLILKLPIVGRISHLNELAHCCRSMSLLFRAGLPLPEIMSVAIQGSNNKVMAEALTDVQRDMLKGQGLSRPMAKNQLFLPMMVQMIGVGEETGNLDVTLLAVAQSYETEAEDKTHSLIGLIQPTMTIAIGILIAFIALSLVSAMYSVYGQVA